jgi:hypothetical protein
VFFSAVNREFDIKPRAGRVGDLLNPDLLGKFTNEAIAFLRSLPRQYQFFFPIGEDGCGRGLYPITADLSVCEFPEDTSLSIHESGPNFQQLDSIDPELTHRVRGNSAYLCVRSTGLFSARSNCRTTAGAIALIKQFLLLSRLGCYTPYFRPKRFKTGFVIDDTEEPSQASAIVLPNSVGHALAEWGWNWWTEPEDIAADCSEYASASSEAEIMTLGLRSDLRTAVEATTTGDAESLRPPGFSRACGWTLDAIYESDESLRALLIGMAFEALLGGGLKKQGSQTERLCDRLAYLVGRSQSDRNEVHREFYNFYSLRSEIAHGDKNILSEHDRRILSKALGLLGKTLVGLLHPSDSRDDPGSWLEDYCFRSCDPFVELEIN